MADTPLMKDGLNAKAIKRISLALQKSYPNIDTDAFEKDCKKGLNQLELKERVHHIIDVMARHLPDDFAKTAKILAKVKKHWQKPDNPDALSGFAAWPIIDYVAVHGSEHPDIALPLLKTLTPMFSAEFAIRTFIIRYPELTFEHLYQWIDDEDDHVRRLVSEGTRPRLPWGQRLVSFCDDPKPVIPLLTALNDDDSDYVRRSVANNLNDIAKDHPELVISTCRQWQQEGQRRKKGQKDTSKNTQWVIKHSCRSLVKFGHPQVFGLLGYTESPQLKLGQLQLCEENIQLGDSIRFSFTVKSRATKPQRCVIDYAIHYMKANGQTSPKVFKLKAIDIAPGETLTLEKSQAFKPITTRKYYSGIHHVEILVNGEAQCRKTFTLSM